MRVAEFRRFVKATSYVTVAERPPGPADYPEADPALFMPGSLVLHTPRGRVSLHDDQRRLTAVGWNTAQQGHAHDSDR